MTHLHGLWLFACGHEAFRCRCIDHAVEPPRCRTDLCAECRRTIGAPATTAEAQGSIKEPFPLATD